MAVECDWAIFCERAYFDPPRTSDGPPTANDHLCIINVIERISSQVVPSRTGEAVTFTRTTPFMLVAHLIGIGKMDVGLRVWAPSGADGLAPWYQPEGMEHADPYLLFRLGVFDFLEEGPYRFDVLFGGEVVRTAVLHVTAPAPPGSIVH